MPVFHHSVITNNQQPPPSTLAYVNHANKAWQCRWMCARVCVFAVWWGCVSMCLCECLWPRELIGTKYNLNIVITSSLWWVIALSWSMSACVDTYRGGSAPRTEFQSAPHKHLRRFWNVAFRMFFNFTACGSTMPNSVLISTLKCAPITGLPCRLLPL